MVTLKKDQGCCEFAQWAINFGLDPTRQKGPYVTG